MTGLLYLAMNIQYTFEDYVQHLSNRFMYSLLCHKHSPATILLTMFDIFLLAKWLYRNDVNSHVPFYFITQI